MTKKDFFNYIEKNYRSVMYEINPEVRLKLKYRAYGYSGAVLYYEIYKIIKDNINKGSVVADIGAFPGTFLRILQNMPQGNTLNLNGAGLFLPADEIAKYRQFAQDNLDTECIVTDKDLCSFLRSTNINAYKLNLDYCYSHDFLAQDDSIEILYGRCDIVTCMETIEHLHTPYKLFDLCNKLLKPGGICVIETNNIRNLWGLKRIFTSGSNLDSDLCDKYSLNKLPLKDPHIRFYSIRELKNLFGKAGFRIKKSYDFNFYIPLKYIKDFKFKAVIWFHLLNILPGYRSHIVVVAQKTG